MKRFLGAVQMLTVVPILTRTEPPGRCAMFYPLVGALIGAAGGGLFSLLRMGLEPNLAALLTVGFWVLLTGALHEDGVADCADAFRAGRPRHRILEILKDPRVGAFGALALILSVGLRAQALASVPSNPVIACAAVHGMTRSLIVALSWITAPVPTGSAYLFARDLTTPAALAAIVQGAAFSLLLGRQWFLALAIAYLVVLFAKYYFERRIQGINGDCLGAAEQLGEVLLLVLLTCQSCTW